MSDEVSKLTARLERLLAEERAKNEKLINKLSREVEALRVSLRREKDFLHQRIDDVKDFISWTIAVFGLAASIIGILVALHH